MTPVAPCPALRALPSRDSLVRRRPAAAALVAALVTSALASPAAAEPPLADDGVLRPKVVQNRLFPTAQRFEVSLLGDFNLNPYLTVHYGGGLGFAYAFNEFLAVEAVAAGGMGGLSNLARSVRAKMDEEGTIKGKLHEDGDLTGMGAPLGTAQLGLRFTPFYGKLNLAAELPLHFSLYFVGSGGGAYVRWESMQVCTENPSAAGRCVSQTFKSESAMVPAFGVGAGMRVFLTRSLGIKAEVRNLTFPDRAVKGADLQDPVNTGGKFEAAGLTHMPFLLFGATLLL